MTTAVLKAGSGANLPSVKQESVFARFWATRDLLVAVLALAGIVAHLALKYVITAGDERLPDAPLLVVLLIGGSLLVLRLLWHAVHGRFGSDQLAGISIVASWLLGEYLAGVIVVLMLSGGETLEQFAVVVDGYIFDRRSISPMRERWHSACQGSQHRRRPSGRWTSRT